MGTGRQYWSWIHWKDWVALVTWLATDVTLHSSAAVAPSEERGEATAWNVTAPEPVTNAAFARMLGRVLHRPAVLPAPAFALRIVLGEFSTFVTGGARVLPARATRAGFRFAFPELEPALVDLLRPRG
jgi:NAD dependent epimerase/dehydratase family enzyme